MYDIFTGPYTRNIEMCALVEVVVKKNDSNNIIDNIIQLNGFITKNW